MEAIVFDEFGGPDVLHLAEVEEPHAGAGQVRIRVAAVGVNPIDFKIRQGLMEQVFPTPLPKILGIDVAGVVDEVGEGITDLAVGDEVVGHAESGGYAQYATATRVARKPAGLSWASAVALPVAGETSQRVLDLLGVSKGETLLVHGAAGAVGTIAVQLAVARGATVIGTASEANHDYLRSLGVIPVGYGEGLVERVRAVAPQGVDAVFDVAGQGALPASIELRGGTDRIVTIADPKAGELGVRFTGGGGDSASSEEISRRLGELAKLAADGTVKIAVADTYPLAKAAQAHEASQTGHTRGKIALLVD